VQPQKQQTAKSKLLASSSHKQLDDFARPNTLVDVIIFTVKQNALQVLLVQRPARSDQNNEPFPDMWALPGRYVDTELDVDLLACARRKLHEKTGLHSPYLEQLGSWGSATRDPRGWSATHAYFALVPYGDLDTAPSAQATWFAADDLLPTARLAFDHEAILHAAIERLRGKVEYTSLPAFLLPEAFTLPQLQRCYEAVLGRAVDKSGFRTRMLAADFLEEVGVIESESNRPPVGYRLKDRSKPVVFPRTFSPRGLG
jgi:8-oxo-dGTP diphosphatase